MATFSTNTLTKQGSELMATALATAQSIEFTGLAIGDGAAPETPAALTDLVHKVMDIDISKVYIAASEPGTSIFRASFQNKTGSAFYFREAGIFARLQGTTDEPILYGYANAGDTADLIDTVEEGSLLMQTLLCNIVTGSADVQMIDNPSALITRQDLLEYLPLTGGTMTGNILFHKSARISLKDNDTSGYLHLLGGSHVENGSGVFLYGENYAEKYYKGSFLLRAAKNGSYVDLRGTPDGTLTWHDNAVLTSAGGVLQGILVNRNWAHPVIGSQGYDEQGNLVGGATLYMFPANEPTYKGGFVLRAVRQDGSYVELCGKNDGTLSWNNADIHLVGEIKWYAGTSVPTGYLRCDGSAVSRTTYARLFAAIGTTYGMGDGSTTFNLPNLTNARMVASSNVDIFGNGKALGLTNGTDLYGLSSQNTYYTTGTLVGAKENYNANVAASGGGQGQIANASILGITPDPLKSGVAGTVSLATAVMPIIKY